MPPDPDRPPPGSLPAHRPRRPAALRGPPRARRRRRRWSSATTRAALSRKAMQRLGLPLLQTWQHIAWDIGGRRAGPRASRTRSTRRRCWPGIRASIVDCNRRPDDPEAFRTRERRLDDPGQPGADRVRAAQCGSAASSTRTTRPSPPCWAGSARGGVVPLVVSVHTFTPQMAGDASGRGTSACCGTRTRPVARRMIAGLRAIDGLVVGDNEPYSGKHPSDYTIDHHAEHGRAAAPVHRGAPGPARVAGGRRALGAAPLAAARARSSRDPELRRLRDAESTWRLANHR